MTDAETYLRDLRRALPIGHRRRLLAEVREHFASAVTAEAERGVSRAEAERVTIERLGPAHVLAEQVRLDLRSGALGRLGRIGVVSAACVAIAIGAIAIFAGRHSSPAPTPPQRAAGPTITIDPRTGEVRAVMYAVGQAVKEHQNSITWAPKPVTFYLGPAPPRN